MNLRLNLLLLGRLPSELTFFWNKLLDYIIQQPVFTTSHRVDGCSWFAEWISVSLWADVSRLLKSELLNNLKVICWR